MSLNSAEMKSFCRFLIVVLAVATSLLPSAYAQDCEADACMNCKMKGKCVDGTLVGDGECTDTEACVLEGEQPVCRPFAETPCNCDATPFGCDPYDTDMGYSCENENLYLDPCPPDKYCVTTEWSQFCIESAGTGSGGGAPVTTTTTKPPTCSEENANMRYPHETDCKKYYNCRLTSLTTYGYVESTCPKNYVFDSVNRYCTEPENVPDCVQVPDCQQ